MRSVANSKNSLLDYQGPQLELELRMIKLASAIQEPLELLLARNNFSTIERRVYWWILSKISQFQTLSNNDELSVPSQNLVFNIPVMDLYVAINAVLPPKKPKASGRRKSTTEVTSEDTNTKPQSVKVITVSEPAPRGVLNNNLTYSYFKKVTRQLVQKSVIDVDHMATVDPSTREIGSLAIFPGVIYKNGMLVVEVNRLIVPAMCSLSKGYTKYDFKAAMSLESDYSQILYVRLCRFLDLEKWRVTIQELKTILNANTISYKRFSNFKQRVLTPTLDQINERTDIYVTYDQVTVSSKKREVIALSFTILRRDQGEKRKLRLEAESMLDEIGNIVSNGELQQKAQLIMGTNYSFSPAQVKLIINDDFKLAEFVRLDLQIRNGLLTIKTNPTRYIAAILFPTKRKELKPI